MVAAIVLSTQFIPQFGLGKGIYYSIFHSVSGFCNAGIDLFGNFSSITSYYSNPVIVITLGFLIIIGGLGFYVWQELYRLIKENGFWYGLNRCIRRFREYQTGAVRHRHTDSGRNSSDVHIRDEQSRNHHRVCHWAIKS